jgi:predicted  nucleic acid-binding Zn-ribbon protein
MKELIKKVIGPVQVQFIKRGLCVGCGMPLSKAEHSDRGDGTEKVTCKCTRIYIYDRANDSYRRAGFDEV